VEKKKMRALRLVSDASGEKKTFGSLVLEPQQPVVGEVAHVDFGSELSHVGVFFAHQPAHVGEEEATLRVVWIGVGVAELVVDAMVADPLDDRILHGDGVEEEQNVLELAVGLVGSMTPQSMGTGRYSV
jgi:hypothetical protein